MASKPPPIPSAQPPPHRSKSTTIKVVALVAVAAVVVVLTAMSVVALFHLVNGAGKDNHGEKADSPKRVTPGIVGVFRGRGNGRTPYFTVDDDWSFDFECRGGKVMYVAKFTKGEKKSTGSWYFDAARSGGGYSGQGGTVSLGIDFSPNPYHPLPNSAHRDAYWKITVYQRPGYIE